MIELEASNGNPDASAELHQEICHLRSRADHLDSELRQKDKEIDQMRKRMDEQCQVYTTSHKVDDKLKVCLFYHWFVQIIDKQLQTLQDLFLNLINS